MSDEKENTIQKSFVGEDIRDLAEYVEESVGELLYTRFPEHRWDKCIMKVTIEFYPDGESND